METEPDDSLIEPQPADTAEGSAIQFTEGELERPKISFLYRFSLVFVCLGMILLPVLYVGLIGLFGYGVYYFAVHAGSILSSPGPGMHLMGIRLLLYFGPLFAGLVMLFFLIKPVFFRLRNDSEHFSIDVADAPQLFAFIGWICRSLDAPIPSRIDMDCSVNASAGFRAGLRSMFGNDIILTIGLPLVAGLNVDQLAGVIAHEYGHFSQGSAMRAHYIIRQINFWFFRLVYQRDGMDMALEQSSEDDDQYARVRIFLYMTRLGVWLGRRILWLFMFMGNLLSSFMSRQMEYNADRYQLNLTGTENYLSTQLRIRHLDLGQAIVLQKLRVKWKKEQKLFDQIPHLIVNHANELSAEVQGKVHAAASQKKTGLFDSHPSDADRKAHALAANEPGIFQNSAPAASLFTNFPELSSKATMFHYRSVFGPAFSPDWLIPTAPPAEQVVHEDKADRENIERYFFGIASELRPIIITESKSLVVRGQEVLTASILACREQMEQLLPAAQEALAAFNEADARMLQAARAAHLLQAGLSFDPADFGVVDGEIESAQAAAVASFQAAGEGLRAFEQAAKTRLIDALQLIRRPQSAAVISNSAQLQDEATQLIFVLSRMDGVLEPLAEMRKDCAALETVLEHRQNQPFADNVTATLENLCTSLQQRINQIQQLTARIRYPFQHASENVFVSEYARNKEYRPDPIELTLLEGRVHVEKLNALYQRLLGRLVVIAEQVETGIANPGRNS
ncbi:MAG: heat shock protein HtpX [Pedosphaera sp.]|nr:heat shock protein HtpX [Pedosphaera sp.]